MPQPQQSLPNPSRLSDELDDTTSLLDLLLGQLGNESSLDDERLVDSALAQLKTMSERNQRMIASNTYKLELAEVDEVNNGDATFGSINLGLRKRDELPNMSACARPAKDSISFTHLVEVDGGSVVVVLEEMVMTHTDLTEVTRVVLKHSESAPVLNIIVVQIKRVPLHEILSFSIPDKSSTHSHPSRRSRLSPLNPHPIPKNCDPTNLVEVGPVVVLTTSQTTTTGVLPVLADTTVTGRDVTSVLSGVAESGRHSG